MDRFCSTLIGHSGACARRATIDNRSPLGLLLSMVRHAATCAGTRLYKSDRHCTVYLSSVVLIEMLNYSVLCENVILNLTNFDTPMPVAAVYTCIIR